MCRIVFLLALLFIVRNCYAQYPCSCTCCLGQNCQPVSIGYIYAPLCTADSCSQTCRDKYYQCSAVTPYGYSLGQCLSTTAVIQPNAPYSCRCDCCNSGNTSCSVMLIGYTTTYSCTLGSCSIACSSSYPLVCISNQYGQTQGTCQGLTSTTTSSTTTGPWLGNACSCYCCQSGPYCSPYALIGNTSSSQCSTAICTAACQTRYPASCPLLSTVGQTLGQCLNVSSGSTKCRCTCCGTISCRDYYVYTNNNCITCPSVCAQYTTCVNTYQTTGVCEYTNSASLKYLSSFQLILVIKFSFLFYV